MFSNNEFPDMVLEGPPTNANTRQPVSKEHLLTELVTLQAEIDEVQKLMQRTKFKGKTKHPGLMYFNAEEWFQFAEMHFMHHLRQKKRIDDLLFKNAIV